MTTPYVFSLEGKNYSVDLQSPLTINNLVVEISSRCNLRCTICPKSEKDHDKIPGRDMDMPPGIIEKTLSFVKAQKVPHISFIGVGEPTFRNDWREVFDHFYENEDISFLLTSNMGIKYQPEDIDCLLRFSSIVISMESADASIQKEIRKSVDLRTIVSNIVTIRARARFLGVNRPRFFVNCTVSQRNVLGLKELAALCVELGVDQLNLSSLYESESASALGNKSIEWFSPEQLYDANQEVLHVQQVLAGSSTRLAIQPRLLQLLNGEKEAGCNTEGQTRICVQPWGSYTIGADGQVFPCCAADKSFINISESSEDIVNGEAIRQLRRQLLEGNLPKMCIKCSNASFGTKDELAKTIAVRAFNEGRFAPWHV